MQPFKKISIVAGVLAFALVIAGLALGAASPTPALAQAAATPTPEFVVDHSIFQPLQGPFTSGPEVTAACLTCHPGAAQEIMATTHWTWEYIDPVTGDVLGKKNVINNYCIAVQSNEPRCTSCHVGYGWADNTFDFTVETNVDCLVCHDTTGTYLKFPTDAGHPPYVEKEISPGKPVGPVDLVAVAQSVGKTSRQTCGSCHFFGGGDDAVKHGDLDSSLNDTTREVDVHMGTDGLNFTCTACHQTDGHAVPGTRYTMNSTDRESCETCHTSAPHANDLVNQHTARVACQTCHIPEYARGGKATKMFWDWSKAGIKNEDGTLKIVRDENGNITYDTRKGEFVWDDNVIPEYIWFNGTVDYITLQDVIDPSGTVILNEFQGDRSDPNARIVPIKVFTALQPYDSVNNTLVVPHLFGSDPAAYWKSYDWNAAIAYGMDYVGADYSGEYGFVQTEMIWMENHMVAPAENSLRCQDCHSTDGRVDFSALGYSAAEVDRLVNFPPDLMMDPNVPESSPDACASCHEVPAEHWNESAHSQNNVGCVACHQPIEAGGSHPTVAMTVNRSADLCGTCHLDENDDWKMSKHAEIEISCIACHDPHRQQQRLVGTSTSVCTNCHMEQNQGFPHSTHADKGVTCDTCHVSGTELSTGHQFIVQSDTCINCHGGNIHETNLLVGVSAPEQPVEGGEEMPASAVPGTDWSPLWVGVLAGILSGVAFAWTYPRLRKGSAPAEAEATGSDESKPE